VRLLTFMGAFDPVRRVEGAQARTPSDDTLPRQPSAHAHERRVKGLAPDQVVLGHYFPSASFRRPDT